MKPIHLRNIPPPAETFDHPAFMEFIFSYLKPEKYLELGVRDGTTFLKVAKYCRMIIGVDIETPGFNRSEVQCENYEFHTKDTDSYFRELDSSEMFDAVFIDADHSHEQSLRDFLNVKDRIIEDGFIFLHDTYPYDEAFFDPGACNDVYKTALYIKNHFIDEFEILTFPFNPGVTVVKKMRRDKQLIYVK
jgi:predicted O-methyltransferase YrrM